MFKLNQATAEGWTIRMGDGPLAIISLDNKITDLAARGKVFNEVMGGSAYHIEALDIVMKQDASRIAIPPKVTTGDRVKLTEPVTVMVTKTDRRLKTSDDGSSPDTNDPDNWEDFDTDVEVTKPAGTVARVVAAAFPPAFTIRFDDDSETSFDEDSWFPFVEIETMTVLSGDNWLLVDKASGAVLAREGDAFADVLLVNTQELAQILGEVPDAIDPELVRMQGRGGNVIAPSRRNWLLGQLDEGFDPVFAAILRAELG